MRSYRLVFMTLLVLFLGLLAFWGMTSTDNTIAKQTAISINVPQVKAQIKINQTSFKAKRRIVLKKNSIKGENILNQSMLLKDSAIYVVKYNYDLNGDTIIIPNNSIVEFRGGSICNGTIKGHKSLISNTTGKRIFKDVTFAGSYLQDSINSNWFEYDNLNHLFDAIQTLATSEIQTQVTVEKMDVTYNPIVRGYYKGEKTSYLFKVPSNTVVDFCGSKLTLAPNDISFFYAIYIQDVSNIEVKNLTLIGDVEEHTPTRYNEFSHGIYIYSAQNVLIENILSTKFWGDGMGITGYSDSTKTINNGVTIRNCKFAKNRRQGCSITLGINMYFDNCEFVETGTIRTTPPSTGVDVEPNNGGDILRNIVFKNCKFLNNEGSYGGILIMTANLNHDLDAEALHFYDCEIDGIHQYGKGGGYFKSCVIKNSKNRLNCLNASKNQIVEDCTIEFHKINLRTNQSVNIKYINNRNHKSSI